MAEYIFEVGGRRGRTQAESMQGAWDNLKEDLGEEVPNLGEIGAIITSPDGFEQFISEAYASTDAEQIQRIREENLSAPEASRVSFLEQAIASRPFSSRAATAIQGVPFAGEYADEAVGAMFGQQAQDAMRLSQAAMAERRPGETLALQLSTGLAATAPLAAFAIPARGTSLARNIMQGAGAGFFGGGAEGFVSGFGAGQTQAERALNAQQRAILGAGFGGAFGTLAPTAGAAFGRLGGMVARRRASQAAEELGVPEPAALAAGGAISLSRPPTAAPTRPTSLAEASLPARRVLDAAMSVPSAATETTLETLRRQAEGANAALTQRMDDLLGQPRGVETQVARIMSDTADERRRIYDTAYSQTIDYTSDAGQRLLSLLRGVPQRVMGSVDEALAMDAAMDNVNAWQRLPRLGPDGAPALNEAGEQIFDRVPSVAGIDAITDRLQDLAEGAAVAGNPRESRRLSTLAQRINSATDDLVDEYRAARSRAAEIIGDREAIRTGYDIMRLTMTREDVAAAIAGMNDGQLSNVRSGIRQYIDDLMSRARSVDEADAGYAELRIALSNLGSREARDKMRIVLGDDAANQLFDELRGVLPSVVTRASAAAAGTQTAPRAFAMGIIDDAARSVPTGDIIGGFNEAQRSLLRAGATTPLEARQSVVEGLSPLLSQQMDPAEFMRVQEALRSVPQNIRQSTSMLRTGMRAGGITGLSAAPSMVRLAESLGVTPPVRGGRR